MSGKHLQIFFHVVAAVSRVLENASTMGALPRGTSSEIDESEILSRE